jgi:hypothetical protein
VRRRGRFALMRFHGEDDQGWFAQVAQHKSHAQQTTCSAQQ